uniref:Uncharacterized protein n=2 Tax=Bactrocera latifrons TaxID=174628 RepID=A0A0K8V967_BACLA
MWKDTSPGFSSSSGSASGGGGGGMPPSSMGIGSSAGGTMGNSIHHAQYITVGGSGQSHPLIMTHSRMHQPGEYMPATQQQQQQQYRSNPTSPTTMPATSSSTNAPTYMMRYGVGNPVASQPNNYVHTSQALTNSTVGGYQPQLRGGVAVFPPNPSGPGVGVGVGGGAGIVTQLQTQPSPQVKRKQTPTRPMSFVRALEMTDSMEMQTLEQQQQQQQGRGVGNMPASAVGGPGAQHLVGGARTTTPTPERASVYDMNYEISV